MKYIKLVVGSAMAFNMAAFAMPTEDETKKAEPQVLNLMNADQVALKSGKKTRIEVAQSAMKLADKAESEAAKLLLMKGAFGLYVHDGNLEKAVETMKALKAAIPDLSSANIENMTEAALKCADKKVDGARLRQLLAEIKTVNPFEKVDGFTWSYQVKNGEATISAVSPKPTGNVTIPTTLKGTPVMGIGDSVFGGCGDMKSVTIPESVKTIGTHAFSCCGGLASLSIPRGVTSIGPWAFANCRGFKSVSLPEGLTEINGGAFYCTGITAVMIPPNVKSIGGQAFARCYGLKSVTISAGVTNIADSAFGVCGSLESIYVDSANPCFSSRNGMLCSKDGMNLLVGVNGDVTIPDGVKSIGSGAFGSLDGLKTVTFPSSVTNISESAFRYVNYSCGNLTSVTMLGEKPTSWKDLFKGCGKLKTIHVPANAKSWAGMKEWQGIPLVFDGKKTDEK